MEVTQLFLESVWHPSTIFSETQGGCPAKRWGFDISDNINTMLIILVNVTCADDCVLLIIKSVMQLSLKQAHLPFWHLKCLNTITLVSLTTFVNRSQTFLRMCLHYILPVLNYLNVHIIQISHGRSTETARFPQPHIFKAILWCSVLTKMTNLYIDVQYLNMFVAFRILNYILVMLSLQHFKIGWFIGGSGYKAVVAMSNPFQISKSQLISFEVLL